MSFYEDLTYDEWMLLQDKASLEFQAIARGHKSYPGYTLEEIKKEIFTNYIIQEDSQTIYKETFGERHINSKKLNEQLSRLNKIVFSSSLGEYQSVDKRGHGDTVAARLGGRGKGAETVAFRIEEKAIRYSHYLIEHNLAGNAQTVSDLVRMGFVKYIEMIPIINELKDAVSNRFSIDMEMERELKERVVIDKMLEGWEYSIEHQEQDLMNALRHVDNNEELVEMRDWLVKFMRDALTYNSPTKKEKARVKEFIMGNSRLFNMLTIFEREKLITRELIDDVRMKGIITPITPDIDTVQNTDTKFNR